MAKRSLLSRCPSYYQLFTLLQCVGTWGTLRRPHPRIWSKDREKNVCTMSYNGHSIRMCWTVYSMSPPSLQTRIYKRYEKPGTSILCGSHQRWTFHGADSMQWNFLPNQTIVFYQHYGLLRHDALYSGIYHHFGISVVSRLYPEDGGSSFQRNVGCYLRRLVYILAAPNCMVTHFRRQVSLRIWRIQTPR